MMASSPSFQGSESAARSFKAFSTPRSPNLVCPSAVLERTKEEGFLPLLSPQQLVQLCLYFLFQIRITNDKICFAKVQRSKLQPHDGLVAHQSWGYCCWEPPPPHPSLSWCLPFPLCWQQHPCTHAKSWCNWEYSELCWKAFSWVSARLCLSPLPRRCCCMQQGWEKWWGLGGSVGPSPTGA